MAKHNGANTNLYCDGKFYFVFGCPACDEAYEEFMKPRWERARILAEELKALGMEIISRHADLWRITVEVQQSGHALKVVETGSGLASSMRPIR